MFTKGFKKTAVAVKGFWHDHKALDKAGLGLLAGATAYHGYKAVKEKDTGNAAAAGLDLAGLGLLHRAVNKSH